MKERIITTLIICATLIMVFAIMARCDKVREEEHTKQRMPPGTAEHYHPATP